MGGGPLTWVTALVKPVISRQVCKACPRLSARSLTRARCSSTMRSRSCTWGPPSAFACSQRAASWGVGWGAQSTASHAGRLEQGLAHREALPSARHGPGLAGPPSKQNQTHSSPVTMSCGAKWLWYPRSVALFLGHTSNSAQSAPSRHPYAHRLSPYISITCGHTPSTPYPPLELSKVPRLRPLPFLTMPSSEPLTFSSCAVRTFWKVLCLRINCSTSSTELPRAPVFRETWISPWRSQRGHQGLSRPLGLPTPICSHVC